MNEQKRQQARRARAARAGRRKQMGRYRQNKTGVLCISCIVFLLLAGMSTQIFRLYQKNEALKEKESQLVSQLESEQERQEEIQSYESYVTTPEYIERIAKTKLGLVYPGEIIFKEQTNEP